MPLQARNFIAINCIFHVLYLLLLIKLINACVSMQSLKNIIHQNNTYDLRTMVFQIFPSKYPTIYRALLRAIITYSNSQYQKNFDKGDPFLSTWQYVGLTHMSTLLISHIDSLSTLSMVSKLAFFSTSPLLALGLQVLSALLKPLSILFP